LSLFERLKGRPTGFNVKKNKKNEKHFSGTGDPYFSFQVFPPPLNPLFLYTSSANDTLIDYDPPKVNDLSKPFLTQIAVSEPTRAENGALPLLTPVHYDLVSVDLVANKRPQSLRYLLRRSQAAETVTLNKTLGSQVLEFLISVGLAISCLLIIHNKAILPSLLEFFFEALSYPDLQQSLVPYITFFLGHFSELFHHSYWQSNARRDPRNPALFGNNLSCFGFIPFTGIIFIVFF
jgi:hypothetical protein